jgi:hypothetical protein
MPTRYGVIIIGIGGDSSPIALVDILYVAALFIRC